MRELQLENFKILANVNEDVGRQLYLFNNFEKDEVEFFKNSIKNGDVCFDVGANIGYFTLLFSKFNGGSDVHIFEPIKSNIEMIEKSLAINSIKNVTINQTAVGNSDGNISFSISEDSAFSSIHDTGRKPLSEVIEVGVLKIDTYVNQNDIKRIDVLKIDVEGAEELVIMGAKNTLTDPNKRPRLVMIELYDLNLKGFNTSRVEIIRKMKEYGYSPFVISNNFKLVELNESKHSKYYNVIFQPGI